MVLFMMLDFIIVVYSVFYKLVINDSLGLIEVCIFDSF